MAKKKKRKETKKKDTGYKVELIGLLLILIAIIGFIPNTGPVGEFISDFSVFLVGTWYNLLLAALMVVGVYMMIKREKPDFFTSKLIGLYIFIIGILVFSHVKYLENTKLEGLEIITETVNNFMSSKSHVNVGGGIIGAIFSLLFVTLFALNGTRIVTLALLICGSVMFTGVSMYDAIKAIINKLKQYKKKEKEIKDKKEIEKVEDNYDKDDKIVVSSVDELIHMPVEDKITVNDATGEVIEKVDENSNYVYPPITLLDKPTKNKNTDSKETINHNVETLEQVFKDFSLEGKVVAINPGPTVTQYEMEIKSGTKLSKILSLHNEIALALAAKDVRIQAPIPGKSTIGVEIPNKVTAMVTVREILESIPKSMNESKLLVTLGRNIMGRPVYCEINKTPHLLVAGSTGSGKSVCINSIIISILMRAKPDEVKLVLVDPKKVELSMYNGVPHLLAPVVTDPKKANIALKKIVVEMERRYDLFSNSGTKNIAGYNAYIDKKMKN